MIRLEREGAGVAEAEINDIVVGGMTALDEDAIHHHLEEMKAIGVKMPDTFPFFFRISAGFLTQADRVQVLGTDSSGEVEAVVVTLDDGRWLTLGSDHTDRKVEAYSINVSKQMCPKIIGRKAWRFDEVSGHWDKLIIRSWTTTDGVRALYQEGPLASMRHPDDLTARYLGGAGKLAAGTVLFCGTIGAMGPLAHSERFEMEIEDPVLGRRIGHGYDVEALSRID
ncbi:uncharacterized protein DUF2848 [Stella humosa]|uniref:Uncharacterized protein DUF2848 n=1 Tax=Stella humosa TaxID=94 RepID=A0A3N1KRV8_9PROT|nr:DUF2848 domain-containing protein [Stella humosa]ROP81120.1 uncharacterized protein DUF2848 [Stella humosa]BBK32465.1 hypothetical protein STHU_30990 [Stella humosa]